MKRASRSKTKVAKKKKPARKSAAKRTAAKRKAPARSAKKSQAKTKAKRPAAKSKRAASGGASLRVESLGQPGLPPPPPPDATEVSGVWGRVLYSENDPYAEPREIFNHYDRDKSGLIESSEFARICDALGMQMDEDQLAIGLSVVDADNDGKISWNDFLSWWRQTRG